MFPPNQNPPYATDVVQYFRKLLVQNRQIAIDTDIFTTFLNESSQNKTSFIISIGFTILQYFREY